MLRQLQRVGFRRLSGSVGGIYTSTSSQLKPFTSSSRRPQGPVFSSPIPDADQDATTLHPAEALHDAAVYSGAVHTPDTVLPSDATLQNLHRLAHTKTLDDVSTLDFPLSSGTGDPLLAQDPDLWGVIQKTIRKPMLALPEHTRQSKRDRARHFRSSATRFDYEKTWSLDEGLRMAEASSAPKPQELHIKAIARQAKNVSLRSKGLAKFIFDPQNPERLLRHWNKVSAANSLEYMKHFRRVPGPSPNRVTAIIAHTEPQYYEQAVALEILRNLDIEPCMPALDQRDKLEAKLQSEGFSDRHIKEWAYALSARDDDLCVERLLMNNSPVPFFVLNSLLRESTANFVRRQSIAGLAKLIKISFVQDPPPANTSDAVRYITNCCLLIKGIAFHCRRLWPAYMSNCAELFVEMMEHTVPKVISDPRDAYATQSALLNCALQSFGRLAHVRPYKNAVFNWQSLRTFLAFSDRQPKTLMLDRHSYLAARLVLLASERSPRERRLSERLQPWWPPYPVARDGIDEQETPESNLSRVVKLGMMAAEAGFEFNNFDTAINTIGGLGPDLTPTMQQRSNLGVLSFATDAVKEQIWVSKIRATRNATEAWAMFNNPPVEGLSWPTVAVYYEMFRKLVSREASTEGFQPGAGRELYPIRLPNLTDFERARLTPPSVEYLYEQMRRDGVQANEACLGLLIQEAASVSDARRYMEDSFLSAEQCTALAGPMDAANIPLLETIPRRVVTGYIRLLCRKHTRNHTQVHLYHSATFYRIQKAVWLAWNRFPGRHPEGASVWPDLLAVMSRSPTVRLHPKIDELQNMGKLLPLFLRAFFHLIDNYGHDMESVYFFFAIIEAYMMPRIYRNLEFRLGSQLTGDMSVFSADSRPSRAVADALPHPDDYEGLKWALLDQRQDSSPELVIWLLRRMTGALFDHARAADADSSESYVSRLLAAKHRDASDAATAAAANDTQATYTLPSDAVHRMMRAWAFTGNFEGMSRLVHWIATEWSEGGLTGHETASTRERNSIHSALCAYRLFAEPFRPAKEVGVLRELVDVRADLEDCGFAWPENNEVELYGQGDLLGHAQVLGEFLERVQRQRGIGQERHGDRRREREWERGAEREEDMGEWWESDEVL